VRLDRNEQRVEWDSGEWSGYWGPLGICLGRRHTENLKFQVKNAGLCAFLLRKTRLLVDKNGYRVGLNSGGSTGAKGPPPKLMTV